MEETAEIKVVDKMELVINVTKRGAACQFVQVSPGGIRRVQGIAGVLEHHFKDVSFNIVSINTRAFTEIVRDKRDSNFYLLPAYTALVKCSSLNKVFTIEMEESRHGALFAGKAIVDRMTLVIDSIQSAYDRIVTLESVLKTEI